jgi:gamma-glutamylputrescine oxidase
MLRIASPDLDDNRSVYWDTATPAEPLPSLRGEITADLVVVGAGFTGLSTAYEVSARFPDRRVVVLEAKRVGNGASGRNGGQMLNWINGVEVKDAERARRVFAVTKLGIDTIVERIERHGLSARWSRDGALETYTHASRAEEAHARTEILAGWGIPNTYLSGAELDPLLRAQGVVGAVLDPTAGAVHGLDYLRGLLGVVQARGVEVYEGTPVLRIDEGATITIETPEGKVRAAAMVIATNGYTPRLGYFRSGLFPLHSHALATAPLPAEQWAEIGWGRFSGFTDDLDRIAYGALVPMGEGRLSLVFGGGSNAAYGYRYGNRTTFDVRPDAWKVVEATLRRYFPKTADVPIVSRWTGTLGITMSRQCTMGVRGEHRNVYYALGYSGHGVALANLAGKVLCDLYSDHHEPWRDLPFYCRRIGGIPPEPLRWVGYHVFTALTGRSPRKKEA